MRFVSELVAVLLGITIAVAAPPTAADAETPWGEAKGGPLVSRLMLVTEQPSLGKPLGVRLDVKNIDSKPASYDSQQSAVNNSLDVKGPDGAAVAHIGGSYQTSGGPTTLQPGESKTIFAELDLSAQYLIEKPGQYTIQSRARGGVPASNALIVTVRPGTLTEFQKLFGALHRAAPKGWRVANYHGTIVFLHTPTRLKADAASISLFFTAEKKHGVHLRADAPEPKHLGETTLGHAWVHAESNRAEERWRDYEKAIAEQLKPFKKAR